MDVWQTKARCNCWEANEERASGPVTGGMESNVEINNEKIGEWEERRHGRAGSREERSEKRMEKGM